MHCTKIMRCKSVRDCETEPYILKLICIGNGRPPQIDKPNLIAQFKHMIHNKLKILTVLTADKIGRV